MGQTVPTYANEAVRRCKARRKYSSRNCRRRATEEEARQRKEREVGDEKKKQKSAGHIEQASVAYPIHALA